jgi:hypothetical protein
MESDQRPVDFNRVINQVIKTYPDKESEPLTPEQFKELIEETLKKIEEKASKIELLFWNQMRAFFYNSTFNKKTKESIPSFYDQFLNKFEQFHDQPIILNNLIRITRNQVLRFFSTCEQKYRKSVTESGSAGKKKIIK